MFLYHGSFVKYPADIRSSWVEDVAQVKADQVEGGGAAVAASWLHSLYYFF